MENKQFAKNLKYLRKQSRKTIEGMVNWINKKQGTNLKYQNWSAWEKEKYLPRAKNLVLLVKALGYTEEQLIYKDIKKENTWWGKLKRFMKGEIE